MGCNQVTKTTKQCPQCAPGQAQHTFQRTIYQLEIRVSSNDSSFIRWLDYHLCGWQLLPSATYHNEPSETTAEYHVHFGEETLEGRVLKVLIGPDDPEVRSPSWGHLQAHFERAITRAARRYLAPCHVIHAGAVAREGRGVLLPGPSGSGKSTLVAALSFSGFDYYSDEVALLNERARLIPYPKAITLKEGGWEAIASLFPDAREAAFSPVHHKALHNIAAPKVPVAGVGETDCSVDFVILPRHASDEATSLAPISRAVALTRLANKSLNLRVLNKPGFDLLYFLVKHADCYALTYSDLPEAVRLVDSLVTAKHANGADYNSHVISLRNAKHSTPVF